MNLMRPMLENVLKTRLAKIEVNTQVPGVVLPENLMQGVQVLRLSRRLPKANLRLTEAGVEANLSFGGDWRWCFVPWDAVTGVIDWQATEGIILSGTPTKFPH